MSALRRFFRIGSKSKKVAPEPSSQDAAKRLEDMEAVLVKKQEHLEARIEEELAHAKKAHASGNKKAALQALTRKKQLSKQLEQLDGQLVILEGQRAALENASLHGEVIATMTMASKAQRTAQKNMNLDQVHDIMEEISEQMEVANEMAEAISNPFGTAYSSMESLEGELEDLVERELDRSLIEASVPLSLPGTPSAAPGQKTTRIKGMERKIGAEKDIEELRNWAVSS